MSFLTNIQNFVNTVVPKLESKIGNVESSPAGKVGVDILKQLASSVFSKDGKGGVFSEKLQLSLPNPLAKLNKLLADIGQKFASGGDFLKNIGNFLTGNRTLENGTQVNVPPLQDRAATSAAAAKSVASSLTSGSTSTGSTSSASTAKNTSASTSAAKTTSTSNYASTAKSGEIVGGTGSVLNQMGNTGGAFTWNGLSKTQQDMLDQSGLDASTPEGKRMILQFKMQNYSEVMQLVSNVAKQLSDISKSIIRNIS